MALTLDDLVDYSGLKKSLPNVSERLKKLHLRLTLEDVKYFTTFVEDVTSFSHSSGNKLLRLDQLVISDAN